jgi:hypothetical protein
MFGYERTIERVREACAEGISAEDLVEPLMEQGKRVRRGGILGG